MIRRLGVFFATFAYVGYAPVAPGTFGSAAGLVVYYFVHLAGSRPLELGVIAGIFVLGIWSGTEAEHHFGGTDPGPVVIDEVMGMLITLAFLPVTLTGAIVGFFLFRVLDVIKPWPSSRMESLPGGLGVMADDGMAAIYGNVIMQVLVRVAPHGWLT